MLKSHYERMREAMLPIPSLYLSGLWITFVVVAIAGRPVISADPKPNVSLSLDANSIHSLAFTRDGKFLACGCGDSTVRIVDVQGGRVSETLRGHEGIVHCVKISPDGELLASCSRDHTIRLWGTKGWKPLAALKGHSDAVTAVCFSPNGETLISCGEDGTAKVWNLTTRKERTTISPKSGALHSVCFAPDSRSVAFGTASPGKVVLWNVELNKQLSSFRPHGPLVSHVFFAREGQEILSSSFDGCVKRCILDDRTKKPVVSKVMEKWNWFIYEIVLAPDRKHLVVCAGHIVDGGELVVCEMPSGKPVSVLSSFQGLVYCAAFSRDNKLLAAGTVKSELKIWDAAAVISPK